MTRTNPFNVIIDLKLEGDYIQQDSCVELMKEFAKREIEALHKQVKKSNIDDVSERYLHMNDAAALIKSMPTDQAIEKMKAALSGHPETTVIDGELLISYHNAG